MGLGDFQRLPFFTFNLLAGMTYPDDNYIRTYNYHGWVQVGWNLEPPTCADCFLSSALPLGTRFNSCKETTMKGNSNPFASSTWWIICLILFCDFPQLICWPVCCVRYRFQCWFVTQGCLPVPPHSWSPPARQEGAWKNLDRLRPTDIRSSTSGHRDDGTPIPMTWTSTMEPPGTVDRG